MPVRFRCVLIMLLCVGTCALQTPPPALAAQESSPPEPDLMVMVGALYDGTGSPPREGVTIVVSNGRIADIVPTGGMPQGTTAPVIDAHDATVLPGLVNAHAHVLAEAPTFGGAWGRQGVTTVADLATPLPLIYPLRLYFAQRVSPHLVVSGPMVTAPLGYPTLLWGPDYAYAVSPEADVTEEVQLLIELYQVDVVKVAVSSLFDWPQLTLEQLREVVQAAHAAGRRVIAHVDTAEDMAKALAAGVDTLSQLPAELLPDELLQQAVDQGVIIVAALSRLQEESARKQLLANARRFHELGGRLALGDATGETEVRAGLPVTEMQLLAEAGLSPVEVLAAATVHSAAALGIERLTGTVEVGKFADFLVVKGDALQRLLEPAHLIGVVKGGVITRLVTGGERLAPLVRIISPAEEMGAVRGLLPVQVEATAAESRQLGSIAVDLDHQLLYYGKDVPAELVIDTVELPDGYHRLGVTVIDDAEHVTRAVARFHTDNWTELRDEIDPPLESAWFGVIDMSRTAASSSGWQYATYPAEKLLGDAGRRVRSGTTPEYLIWKTPLLTSFTIEILALAATEQELSAAVVTEVSADGEVWQQVEYTAESAETEPDLWGRWRLSGRAAGANWFRLTLQGDWPPHELQVGSAVFVMLNQ